MVRSFPLDDPLDDDRDGVRDECAYARCDPVTPAPPRDERSEQRDAHPSSAVFAELRKGARRGQHTRPPRDRRLHGNEDCILTARRVGDGEIHEGPELGNKTVSHFCLLVSTGRASR